MKLGLIPFLLLVVPILEIAMFILIGGQIGVFPTLAMIVVTAFIGTILLRLQGFRLLAEIQQKTEAGELPGRALVHGVMLLVAGVLLLTPGFVTDTFGFLLFVPQIRDIGWNFLKSRIQILSTSSSFHMAGHAPDPAAAKGPTIDLDESDYGPTNPNSPWNNQS